MKLWEAYYAPQTPDEAIEILTQYAGRARLVAGGTDLLVERRYDPGDPIPALVDITAIPELCQITEEDEGSITLGAGVTHTQIVKSALLTQRATCLVESCGVIGGPQVRNVATLGGNVAHALPAGDGTTSLVALDALADIFHAGQHQQRPIRELYRGPGQSLLDPTRDMLLRFHLKATQAGEGTAFSRIMRPQGVALPVLGCSVWVRLSEDGSHYADARVCIAPVAPTPQRITAVEDALRGQPADENTLSAAIKAARETLAPRTSKYRATAAYRTEMVEVLLRRTLPKAVERARTGDAIPEGIGL
ncbi:MAG: FAD binding domain-containing protein [Anaerolineales bacterium]